MLGKHTAGSWQPAARTPTGTSRACRVPGSVHSQAGTPLLPVSAGARAAPGSRAGPGGPGRAALVVADGRSEESTAAGSPELARLWLGKQQQSRVSMGTYTACRAQLHPKILPGLGTASCCHPCSLPAHSPTWPRESQGQASPPWLPQPPWHCSRSLAAELLPGQELGAVLECRGTI